ncbi:MAG: DUF3501 family protein, partial [Myxococcales bacterium]|nr:DUF3501 family protein [Myxococcales bacterium]
MKPLTRADILPLAEYQAIRDDFRRRIIGVKKFRRVSVGPHVTAVFENRETIRFQIQEMLRAEGIAEAEKIDAEIETYNTLLPAPGELSATVFLEYTSDEELRTVMPRLLGIEEHLKFLLPGGRAVPATFEPGRSTEDRTSSVHYCRFPFDAAARAAFTSGGEVFLAIDTDAYRERARLHAEVIRALA